MKNTSGNFFINTIIHDNNANTKNNNYKMITHTILKHCYFHFLCEGKRHEIYINFLDGTLCKSVTNCLGLSSGTIEDTM